MKALFRGLKRELAPDAKLIQIGLGTGGIFLSTIALPVGLCLSHHVTDFPLGAWAVDICFAILSQFAMNGGDFRDTGRKATPPAPARKASLRYKVAPKPLRKHPLGPKFGAVALTSEEALPHLVRSATVLRNDMTVRKPIELKLSSGPAMFPAKRRMQ